MQGKLVIGTEIDTTGVEDGLKEVKDIAKDEDIEIAPDIDTKGFEKKTSVFTRIFAKIGNKLTGISTTALRTIFTVIGSMGKLGIIVGVILVAISGIVAIMKKASENSNQIGATIADIKILIVSILNTLAQAFMPIANFVVNVINWILNAIRKVLIFVAGILKNIFKTQIISSNIADDFGTASKNANALKKTLAGFDEMNVMNENGSVGILGAGGIDMSQFDNLSSEIETMSQKIKNWFTKGLPTREELEENANIYKSAWEKIGEFLGLGTIFRDFKTRLEELKKQLEIIWQPVIDNFNETISQIKALFKPFTDYINEHFIKPIKDGFTNWKNEFLSKYAKFINKLIYGANLFLQFFGIQLDYIDEESALTGEDIKENIGDAMQSIKDDSDKTAGSFETLRDRLKDLTSKAWNIVTNFTTNGLSRNTMNNWLQPLRDNLAKMGIKLPYLEKGGIVNIPGKGVPIGSAIAGERGQEGVIPLTDSQQMELLGEAIGKYITINANITNNMDGRTISRQLQKVQNETDFVLNR